MSKNKTVTRSKRKGDRREPSRRFARESHNDHKNPGRTISNHACNTAPLWVSQNFLTGSRTIKKLIRMTSLCADDVVIEIGAGKGHITGVLLTNCKTVIAYEIDRKLCETLETKFIPSHSLVLRKQDFLAAALPSRQPYKVFANIPFHITTEIVRKLTEASNPPQEAWLIMEKGAAVRFCGKKKESLYSLLLKPFYEVKILYYFQQEDFHPAPSVDVVMVHFRQKENPAISQPQKDQYRQFIRQCVTGDGLNRFFTPKQFSAILQEAHTQNDRVSGEILYIQWLCLFRWHWRRTHSRTSG